MDAIERLTRLRTEKRALVSELNDSDKILKKYIDRGKKLIQAIDTIDKQIDEIIVLLRKQNSVTEKQTTKDIT